MAEILKIQADAQSECGNKKNRETPVNNKNRTGKTFEPGSKKNNTNNKINNAQTALMALTSFKPEAVAKAKKAQEPIKKKENK